MKRRWPWRDYLENVLIAVMLALIVRTFVISGYKVPNHSMAPAIQAGDFIFAWRIPFGIKLPLLQMKVWPKMPDRGDIVVFSFPEQPRKIYVKRVVGLPGDKIQLSQDHLRINGKELEYVELGMPKDAAATLGFEPVGGIRLVEEKALEGSRLVFLPEAGKGQDFPEIEVQPGHVFLLGDHRVTSDDSRYWGSVPFERIDGRVFMIWLSLSWQLESTGSKVPRVRWERVFSRLH